MSKRYLGIFIAYAFYILLTLYVFAPIIISLFDVSKDNAFLYGKMIGSVLAAVIILCLLMPVIKKGVSIDVVSLKKSILWIIIGLFMVILAQIVVEQINIYLFKNEISDSRTVSITDRFVSLDLIPMIISFITSVVFAPFFEEIMCRKIIFGTLHRKVNFIFASFISSFIFAVAHLEFNNLLPFIATGFILSFIYVKTKRIIVPIITHSLLNAVVFIGALIQ